MSDDHTDSALRTKVQPDRFLVGSDRSIHNWMMACPRAKTLEAYSETLENWVVIAISCNNWGCPVCGRKKVVHYAKLVADAAPNKLITLTVNPAKHSDPRAAYDETRRKIPGLSARLRRAYGEFEFFRILEITKKGWPHYHLIARSPYIPQAELSNLWAELVGAPIVDVRKIDRTASAYWYVVKYLAKQRYIPWTDRRAAWTRKFFPKSEFKPGQSLNLMQETFKREHPADYLRWWYEGHEIQAYSGNCWLLCGKPPKA